MSALSIRLHWWPLRKSNSCWTAQLFKQLVYDLPVNWSLPGIGIPKHFWNIHLVLEEYDSLEERSCAIIVPIVIVTGHSDVVTRLNALVRFWQCFKIWCRLHANWNIKYQSEPGNRMNQVYICCCWKPWMTKSRWWTIILRSLLDL